MTRRGFHIGFRLLLAFLTWLSLAPVSANAVICIGADGHVAVEPAHLISCHQDEVVHRDPSAHKGVTVAVHGQDHDEPCLDIASPPGAAATKAMVHLNGPAKALIRSPLPSEAPRRTVGLTAPPPPSTAPPSPHLAFMRTVILRT